MEIETGDKKIKNKQFKNRLLALFDRAKERIILFFKYKPEVNRKTENSLHDFLRKESVDASGVANYEKGCFVTRNKISFKIFRLDFLEANGLDQYVEDHNHSGLVQIQDVLVKGYSIIFPQEHKYNLQSSIGFYSYCLENETIESRKEVLRDNLHLMDIFNESKYVSMIVFVHAEDVEKFKKISSMICDITEYTDHKAIELLDMLNNELT